MNAALGVAPQAFFLPVDGSQRFCLFHPAQGTPRGRVLYLHPWAEELNASRRTVAEQARQLAAHGFAVLLFDLFGCGDSDGELADADWAQWQRDAQAASTWLDAHARGPRWLWGLRAGALLAVDLLATLPDGAHLLLWQPVSSGQSQLTQFLRLQDAAPGRDFARDSATAPAQRLANGQSVHIAGHELTPLLADGLSSARLNPPVGQPPGRVVWLESATNPERRLSPGSERTVHVWQHAGWRVQPLLVDFPPFWQSAAVHRATGLLQATLAALASEPSPPESA